MKVVGCGGQLFSGKDTVANHLVAKLGSPWRRLGFADAVKKVYMDTFDVSLDFIEEWKRMDQPPPGFDMTVRKSLQFIGDGFRQMRANIWIETAFRDNSPKVISDLRYLNEAKAIRAHGGLNVLLWRAGFVNNDPNPSESQIRPTIEWFVLSGLEGDVRNVKNLPGGHMTDNGVIFPSLFDFFIKNEGSLDQLYSKVESFGLLSAIKEKYERGQSS